ncbi:MAG: YihY family inner membrane protein [Gammaproteobacteria bacterium]|jgi:membrane protein
MIGRLTQELMVLVDFLAYLQRRFDADHCLSAAAALAYTSLLALVPLFTIVFVAVTAFPAFQQWRGDIEAFIFSSFVPAFGDQVRAYLIEFSDKARGLQTAGMIVLLVTALAMMSTIESAFNVIWRIKRRRPFILRFLVYWAVLTLGPVLIGVSIFVTSYLVSLPLLSQSVASLGLQTALLGVLPLVTTTVAFVMFFKLIPYRPVPLQHALIGGLAAAALFELAKRGFALYVTSFPSQQTIYGAFAIAPIFLIWIYLSWVIVLLGAEITQCLTTYAAASSRKRSLLFSNPLYAAFRVLLRLYEAQDAGQALGDKQLFAAEPDLGFDPINDALERLDKANWISRNDAFEWVLVRDLQRVTVVDLMQISPSIVQQKNVPYLKLDGADERLVEVLRAHALWLEENMALPLASLIVAEDSAHSAVPR